MEKRNISYELMDKYKIGDIIKTKYGDLPIAGFTEFKHYGGLDSMMFPYLRYNGKTYSFGEDTNDDGIHFVMEIVNTDKKIFDI